MPCSPTCSTHRAKITRCPQLKRVSLRDAALVLRDEVADLTWTAPDADLTLNLDDAAILGHLSMELQVQELEIHLEVELFHHRESKMGSAAIGFAGLNLAELALIAPDLEDFAGLRVPLSGTLGFDVAPGGILGGGVFDIAGGEGGGRPARGFSRPGSGPRVHRSRLD